MNYIICEGKYDRVFLELLCKHKLYKNACIIKNITVKDKCTSDMAKLQTTFRSSQGYYKQFDFIIFEDSGKNYIKKLVVPRVVIDGINQEHKFIILRDDDGSDDEEIFTSILTGVKSRVISVPSIICEPKTDNCFVVYTKDNQKLLNHFSLICVKLSLEKEILRRFLSKNNHFSEKAKEKLLQGSPHISIKTICDNLDISPEELVEKCILQDLFENEPWYKNLIEKLKKITG